MRVLLLSDLNSPHTMKWAKALAEKKVRVAVFGLSACRHFSYQPLQDVDVYSLGVDRAIVTDTESRLRKLGYLRAVPRVRKLIRDFGPDILHAHFATSYGTIGALCGFHPYVISAWGSDILVFPERSRLTRSLISLNFRVADKILSTSSSMAEKMRLYTKKGIDILPFGIDPRMFYPLETESELFEKGDIVIGTVKSLHEFYGIRYLIIAFSIVRSKFPRLPLKLLIVGTGPSEQELKHLAARLDLGESVVFAGHVHYEDIPVYHNMVSIFVALSNTDSLGVSVIEASACEKPVVVSDCGGLTEVVEDGVTGLVVPTRDPQRAAEALERLILDEDLRRRMGRAGRARARRLYSWDDSVERMVGIYEGLAAG